MPELSRSAASVAAGRLRRLPRRIGLAGLVAVVGLTVAAPAGLASGSQHGVVAPPAATSAGEPSQSTPVMVVLDASGSMNTSDAPGPRINAAKRAVDDLVDALPASARIGLEVYGTSTSSAAASKAAGCRDIRQVVPLGTVHKKAFKAAVAGIKAHGYTPIGRALQAASSKLPSEGPRSIVLVSDGEDTCAPPAPCDVAKQLNAAGTDLTVHTIGFNVDRTARSQLTCIAASTGGSYRETTRGRELAKILVDRVGVALRPYLAVGTPIKGAGSPVGAPSLKPGQYVDSFRTSDEVNDNNSNVTKYYTVELGPGETLYASATLAVPPLEYLGSSTDAGISIQMSTPDGATCNSVSADHIATDREIRPVTAVLSVAPGGQSVDSSYCNQKSGQYVLAIKRTGEALPNRAMKAEIDVRVEPAANASGLPAPQYESMDDISPSSDSTPTAIDGGSSFDSAPLLQPGTYRDRVVSGETRYYRVHLDYGQRLSYRFGLPAVQAEAATDSVQMNTHVASPVRDDVSSEGTALGFYYGDDPVVIHASTTFQARFTNRASANVSARPMSIDGDYYIVFSSGFAKGAQYQLPLLMTVDVTGTKESGPNYGETGPSIPTATPSTGTSSSTTSTGADRKATSSDKSDGGGTPSWVWVVVTVVVATLVGGGLLIARRRDDTGGSSGPGAPGPGSGQAFRQV